LFARGRYRGRTVGAGRRHDKEHDHPGLPFAAQDRRRASRPLPTVDRMTWRPSRPIRPSLSNVHRNLLKIEVQRVFAENFSPHLACKRPVLTRQQ
jgi:hypothetical protein